MLSIALALCFFSVVVHNIVSELCICRYVDRGCEFVVIVKLHRILAHSQYSHLCLEKEMVNVLLLSV
jgi:hypothetical protein